MDKNPEISEAKDYSSVFYPAEIHCLQLRFAEITTTLNNSAKKRH